MVSTLNIFIVLSLLVISWWNRCRLLPFDGILDFLFARSRVFFRRSFTFLSQLFILHCFHDSDSLMNVNVMLSFLFGLLQLDGRFFFKSSKVRWKITLVAVPGRRGMLRVILTKSKFTSL